MQPEELLDVRRTKWRVAGNAARTLEDASAFLEEVGVCVLYPHRRAMLASTFVGAYLGRDTDLPDGLTARRAPAEMAVDAAAEATADGAKEMMVRLLRRKLAFEAPFGPENSLLIAGSTFPFFYALVGDRNPKEIPATGPRAEFSRLAIDAFEVIKRDGPISKDNLVATLGGSLSEAGIDSALEELWAKLRITRVDYREDKGIFWDVLYRWAPEAVREGAAMSVTEALSALVSKYLDGVVIADQLELEEFFAQFASRARVKEAVNLLLATREITFLRVGAKTALAITPPREEPPPRVAHPIRIRLPKPVRDAMPPPSADGVSEERPRVFARSAKPDSLGRFAKSDRLFAPKREFAGKPREGSSGVRPERRAPRSDRPAASRGASGRFERSDRPASAERPDRAERPARTEGTDRPVRREGGEREERPRFERPARASEGAEDAAPSERFSRPDSGKRPFAKKPFGAKPFGAKKPFGKKPYERAPFGKKPFADKPFRERTTSDRPSEDRPPSDRDKPARSYGDRPGRPPARSSGARPSKPFGKPSGDYPPRRESSTGEGAASRSYAKKPFAKKPFGDRAGRPPARSGGAGYGQPAARRSEGSSDRPSAPRRETSSGEGFARKPFDRGEKKPFGDRAGRPPARSGGSGFSKPAGRSFSKPSGSDSGERPAGRFGAKPGGRPAGKFAGKPGGKPAGKFGGKSFSKPGGKFSKAGGKPAGGAAAGPPKKHYGKLKKKRSGSDKDA